MNPFNGPVRIVLVSNVTYVSIDDQLTPIIQREQLPKDDPINFQGLCVSIQYDRSRTNFGLVDDRTPESDPLPPPFTAVLTNLWSGLSTLVLMKHPRQLRHITHGYRVNLYQLDIDTDTYSEIPIPPAGQDQ
jgi:hypothetical protein